MEEEVLLTETRGPMRLLTLNRPKKLNALNADLLKALTKALLAVQHDEQVAAVVIAGAGRAFTLRGVALRAAPQGEAIGSIRALSTPLREAAAHPRSGRRASRCPRSR